MKFTPAQKKMLERRFQTFKIAEVALNEFVGFLQEEHGVEKTRQIEKDGSGFVEPPKPKVEPKKEVK